MKASSARRLALDATVVLVCLSSALLFLRTFWLDLNETSSRTGETPVGSVIFRRKTAQRRLPGRTVWEGLEMRASVYNLDALRTSEGSEAIVRLDDGTEIGLEENSLIVLAFEGASPKLEFVSGSLVARGVEGGAKSLTISSGDSQFVVEKGAVDLRKGGSGQLALAVDSGSVKVRTAKGPETSIGPSQTMRIEGGKATTATLGLSPLSPSPGAILYAYEDRPNLPFAWRSETPGGELIVELSATSDFRNPTVSAAATGENLSLRVAQGTWWWRVRPKAEGQDARAVKFSLVIHDRPVLTYPEERAAFSYRAAKPEVRLAWEGANDAIDYGWELSGDAAFSSLVARGNAGAASALTGPLEEGEYWWRVRARYAGTALAGGESVARSFVVKKTELPAQVELLSPFDGRGILLSELERDGLFLSWRSTEAASYLVEIARDPGFGSPLTSVTQTATSYRIGAELKSGLHYWRVTALDGTGTASLPSAPRSFEVAPEDREVALEFPPEGFAFAPGRSGSSLSWRSSEGILVKVTLERAPGGELVFEKKLVGKSVALPALSAGSYRWIALPASAAVSGQAPGSGVGRGGGQAQPRGFVVVAPPPPPSSGEPSGNARLSLVNVDSLSFVWKESPSASLYRFELIDPKGETIVRSQSAETRYEKAMASSLLPGRYEWTVSGGRAASELAEEVFGEKARFVFRIDSVRTVAAAKLRSPAQGARIEGLTARRTGVGFAWKNPEAGLRSFVQLSRDPGFAESFRSLETKGENLVVLPLESGTYWWKLVSRTKEDSALPDSEVFSFTVAAIPLLPAPRILAPVAGAVIDMRAADTILFRWERVALANAYQLSLASARSGRVVWSADRVKENEYRFDSLEALDVGEFLLGVKALSFDQKGALEQGGKAAETRFSVRLGSTPPPNPILISPSTIYVP